VAILEKIHPYLRNNQGTLSINSFILQFGLHGVQSFGMESNASALDEVWYGVQSGYFRKNPSLSEK